MSNTQSYNSSGELTIRYAGPADDGTLRRLAELDSAPRPAAPVLLAEIDGTAVAALSVSERRAVADPFQPSGHLVGILREHARRPHPGSPAGSRLASGLHGRSAPWPV